MEIQQTILTRWGAIKLLVRMGYKHSFSSPNGIDVVGEDLCQLVKSIFQEPHKVEQANDTLTTHILKGKTYPSLGIFY